jgi:uncharacterized protein (DUF433 family)
MTTDSDPLIVSNPDSRGGRWCFAGTSLPVSIAHYARTEGRQWVLDNYPQLTDAMIDAGLAWPFPAVQDVAPLIEDLTVDCACGEEAGIEGEHRTGDVIGAGAHVYRCNACGRRWRVTVGIEQIPEATTVDDESLPRATYGHAYRIWAGEITWFFANIRAHHPGLIEWAERYEPRFMYLVSHQRRAVIEWGTMSPEKAPLFEAALADLDAGRIDREDGKRILPKWLDGSYRPMTTSPTDADGNRMPETEPGEAIPAWLQGAWEIGAPVRETFDTVMRNARLLPELLKRERDVALTTPTTDATGDPHDPSRVDGLLGHARARHAAAARRLDGPADGGCAVCAGDDGSGGGVGMACSRRDRDGRALRRDGAFA